VETKVIGFPVAITGRQLCAILPHIAVPDEAEVEVDPDGTMLVSTDDRAWRLSTRLTRRQLVSVIARRAELPPALPSECE
jgi:hypothetical protein